MKKSVLDAKSRHIDSALTIWDLFAEKDFPFDFVIATLNGDHPTVTNRRSDRAYFVLSGEGLVTVGNTTHAVRADDLIAIPAGTPHSLRGNLRYAIITSPPFDPRDEQ
jgi:mannose-6-phosphate isomerase-like protein (cupin superfamily)